MKTDTGKWHVVSIQSWPPTPVFANDAQAAAFETTRHWSTEKRMTAAGIVMGAEFAQRANGLYDMEECSEKYEAIEKLHADFGELDYCKVLAVGQALET